MSQSLITHPINDTSLHYCSTTFCMSSAKLFNIFCCCCCCCRIEIKEIIREKKWLQTWKRTIPVGHYICLCITREILIIKNDTKVCATYTIIIQFDYNLQVTHNPNHHWEYYCNFFFILFTFTLPFPDIFYMQICYTR